MGNLSTGRIWRNPVEAGKKIGHAGFQRGSRMTD